jgi:NAD(P)-dependent dehydrogenase (short-subunit alcohol dehydrogenase family)
MDKVAVVTGADRGLGLGLSRVLLRRGWTVLAGQHMPWPELDALQSEFPVALRILPLDVGSDASVADAAKLAGEWVSHVDLMIANAAINRSAHLNSLREEQNFDDWIAEYNVNAVGPMRAVRAFLPLLEQGAERRLCFISSEAGSIGASSRTGWFGYCMSKAALNMAVKNLHNDLTREGFRFRLYHPGWLRTYMSGTKNDNAHMEPEEAAEVALRYFLDEADPLGLSLHDWEGNDFPW